MGINARQEQFADAFLITVAAVAGFIATKPPVDARSVGFTAVRLLGFPCRALADRQ